MFAWTSMIWLPYALRLVFERFVSHLFRLETLSWGVSVEHFVLDKFGLARIVMLGHYCLNIACVGHFYLNLDLHARIGSVQFVWQNCYLSTPPWQFCWRFEHFFIFPHLSQLNILSIVFFSFFSQMEVFIGSSFSFFCWLSDVSAFSLFTFLCSRELPLA